MLEHNSVESLRFSKNSLNFGQCSTIDFFSGAIFTEI